MPVFPLKMTYLLALDNRKGTSDEKRIRLFAGFLGLVNLIFCSYMDHLLRRENDGRMLGMLLFVELAAIAILTIGAFNKSGPEILWKSSLYPVSSFTRLSFVIISSMRRPSCRALWLTTAIFFLVYYHTVPVVAVMSVILYSLAVVTIIILVSALCAMFAKRSQPVLGLTAISAVVIIGVLFASFVLRAHLVISSMPLVAWTANGILDAQRGQWGAALLHTLCTLATAGVILFFGKRFA
ncbi:MAG TPA: hypothetical protein VL633_02910 [Bacteroidota bacterium]|jgi:hypothetical protein|nr:hypothetical protein [Bacteroidota bacterium]